MNLMSCQTAKIFIAILTLFFCGRLFAGAVSGGGGKAIVCRNESNQILSAELLDIYEAKLLWGHSIKESTDSYQEQVETALQVLPTSNRGQIVKYLNIVQNRMKFLPEGTALSPVNDAILIAFPKNCTAEQLANYISDQIILIDSEIWNELNATNKAALIMHEAVYASDRSLGSTTDSRRARRIVGQLFSTETNLEPIDENLPASPLFCHSTWLGANQFWAYKNAEDNWVLQFKIIGGRYPISKKTLVMTDKIIDFNLNGQTPEVGAGVHHYNFNYKIESLFDENDWFSLVWNFSDASIPGTVKADYSLYTTHLTDNSIIPSGTHGSFYECETSTQK